MNSWRRWALTGILVLNGAAAAAQSETDRIVRQLRDQGYIEFTVSRTLLWRTRVLALDPDGGRREIVFNPVTGEILRDYHESADGGHTPLILDPSDYGADHSSPPIAGEPNDDHEPSRHNDESSPPRTGGQGKDQPVRSPGNGLPSHGSADAPPRNQEDRPGGSGGDKKDDEREDED